MRKQTSFFCLFILSAYLVNAQALKIDQGTTRAVVVGISDYQDDNISDLNYAHKDAEAFVAYLESPAGGSLPQENIKLLMNENATNSAISLDLLWLANESKNGDKAIIYFSGHGDVESKLASNPGYLLTFDTPSMLYRINSIDLIFIDHIIKTISSNGAQAIIFADACRSGNLAGNSFNGRQATIENLKKILNNEIKILSCQPHEYSIEGEQWGGGRGAFSYHLIEGLIGLADENEDLQVSLFEIEDYLEEIVKKETEPQRQTPFTSGNTETRVALVDEAVLIELKERKEKQLPSMLGFASKSLADHLISKADSSIWELYQAFITSIENKQLLAPSNSCADIYYRDLIKENSIQPIHSYLKRKFAVALQDEAQQAINAYLLANPSELKRRWTADTDYQKYPRYLGRASELLGKKHYMHPYLQAKKLYFEGLDLRLQGDGSINSDSLYLLAIQKQQKAIEYEDRAAFLYNELGVLYTRLKQDEKAFEYLDKAIELSPEWGLPYVNYSIGLYYNGQYDKAIEYGEIAGQKLGGFPQVYCFLAWLNARDFEWKDNKELERKGVELQDDYDYEWNLWSSPWQVANRFEISVDYLKKAIEVDPKYANAYYQLGYIQYQKYIETSEISLAIESFEKYTALRPESDIGYGWIGKCLLDLFRYEEAILNFEKAIELNPSYATWLYELSKVYWAKNEYEMVIEVLKKALEIEENGKYYSRLARAYLEGPEDLELCELNALKGFNWVLGRNNPSGFFIMGWFYNRMNRFTDAERMCLKAIETMPGIWRNVYQLGLTYKLTNEMEKLRVLCDTVVSKNTNNNDPNFNWWMGTTYLKLNLPEKAEFHFQRVYDAEELNTWELQRIGNTYRQLGEHEKALKYLQRLDFKKSRNYYPKWDEAWVYFKMGNVKKSHDIMEETIEYLAASDLLAEDFVPIWLNALLYYYSGDLEQTNTWLDKAIELDPDYIYRKQALNLFEKGDYKGATRAFEKVMELCGACDKEMKECCDNIPYIYSRLKIKQGKYKEALDLQEQAMGKGRSFDFIQTDENLDPIRDSLRFKTILRAFYPSKFDDLDQYDLRKPGEPFYNPENCLLLTDIYLKMEKPQWAAELCLKAIELKPDYEEAYLQLSKVYRENDDILFDKSKLEEWKNAEEHSAYMDKYFSN